MERMQNKQPISENLLPDSLSERKVYEEHMRWMDK